MTTTIGDHVWQVPQDTFVNAWNAATTLDDVAAAIRGLASGPVPRWAIMARAAALRKDGVSLKPLPANTRSAT